MGSNITPASFMDSYKRAKTPKAPAVDTLISGVKVIYVCSPFGGKQSNLDKAKTYSRFVADKGHVPLAPHLLLPQFMDEKTERATGLKYALALLSVADEVWVFTDQVSDGMSSEIRAAKTWGIPTRWVSEAEVKAGVR